MKFNTVLINILCLALVGAIFVAALAALIGAHHAGGETGPQLAVLALGGTLIGGVVTTMVRLASPDPDPSVPASVVSQILANFGHKVPADLADSDRPEPGSRTPAVLLLVGIGALLVGGMVFVLDSEAAIVTVAGGFIGGVVSLASDMVKPPPNPAVPASVVLRIIDGASNPPVDVPAA